MPVSRNVMIRPLVYYLLLGAQLMSSQHAAELSSVYPQRNYYIAAIFEHARRGNWTTETPQDIKRMNMNYYVRAAKAAKSQGADIIMFPEYGLFPPLSRSEVKEYLEQVPDPKKGTSNPCLQKHKFLDRPVLYNLSCTARENKIVILANIGDIQPCYRKKNKLCPLDGSFHHNANVVFDRDGMIIYRTHKKRLFFEHAMDLATEEQDPIFTTDFGTFASFISFEVMFHYMAEAAQDSRVDSVFLSGMWVETLPLLSALQLWQGWAMGNHATLLAANLQIPGYLALGSGVFTPNLGPLISTFDPDGESKLLVSRVPKFRNQTKPFPNPESRITIVTENGTKAYSEANTDIGHKLPEYCSLGMLGQAKDKYKEYRCIYESTVNYTLVRLTKPKGYLEACNKAMCCSLDYSTRGMKETYYFGIANTTHNSHDRYFWCEEKCLVVRCEEYKGKECSIFPTKSSTIFQRFQLNANFTTSHVYPSVLKSGMSLAPMSEWKYHVRGGRGHYDGFLSYKSSSKSKPLLVAALNARCFNRDSPYIR